MAKLATVLWELEVDVNIMSARSKYAHIITKLCKHSRQSRASHLECLESIGTELLKLAEILDGLWKFTDESALFLEPTCEDTHQR